MGSQPIRITTGTIDGEDYMISIKQFSGKSIRYAISLDVTCADIYTLYPNHWLCYKGKNLPIDDTKLNTIADLGDMWLFALDKN